MSCVQTQEREAFWLCLEKDDLPPLIERILEADALIIGTPIYWGEPTAQFRALMERLVFCTLPYEAGTYFQGKVDVGFIYTMNAGEGYYEQNLRPYLTNVENLFRMRLHGEVKSYASCDTLQVKDYSRYDMAYFSEEDKRRHREDQFPTDQAECFKLGAEMGR